MASSSSDPHASSSSASFPHFDQEFNFSDFDPTSFDSDNVQTDRDAEAVQTLRRDGGDMALDDFFGLDAMNNFDFAYGNSASSSFDPFNFDSAMGQPDIELSLDPSSIDFAAASFPEFGMVDLGVPFDMDNLATSSIEASSFDFLNDMSISDMGNILSQAQELVGVNPSSEKHDDIPTKTNNAQPMLFPARNPSLRLHTPPENTMSASSKSASPAEDEDVSMGASPSSETSESPITGTEQNCGEGETPFGFAEYPIPVDANGMLDPLVVKALDLTDPRACAHDLGPSAILSRPRNTRSRSSRSPAQCNKEKETPAIASSKSEPAWVVYTMPETDPSVITDSPIASGSGSSSGASGADSNSNGKRPGRRKEIFQLVPPPTEKSAKPEWFVTPPPWNPESLPPAKPKKKLISRETHSDMGWVLARLREPDCERPQYGWAVAQIHNPRESSYLVLSGPHVTKIKTVRAYDRIAYSPENIAQLKERCQEKESSGRKRGPGAKGEKVYDTVTADLAVVARQNNLFLASMAKDGILSLSS